jgi:hypothetical protein
MALLFITAALSTAIAETCTPSLNDPAFVCDLAIRGRRYCRRHSNSYILLLV